MGVGLRKSKKIYSCLFIISLLASICITAHVRAEVTGPGWFDVKADPVSPADARAYYSSKQGATEVPGIAGAAVIAQATSASDEVNELARALQYDPLLIFVYCNDQRNEMDRFRQQPVSVPERQRGRKSRGRSDPGY